MSGHDDHGELGHILPKSLYYKVFWALMVLTVVTVVLSKPATGLDFGALGIAIAMVIASVKAALVALFFMHLRYENPLTWLYAFFPLFLLARLIGGVFIDNPLRLGAGY